MLIDRNGKVAEEWKTSLIAPMQRVNSGRILFPINEYHSKDVFESGGGGKVERLRSTLAPNKLRRDHFNYCLLEGTIRDLKKFYLRWVGWKFETNKDLRRGFQ